MICETLLFCTDDRKYRVLTFADVYSAGIGRTGTYIALDSLTREGEAEGAVEIPGCIINMRQNRSNMVQTAVGRFAKIYHCRITLFRLVQKYFLILNTETRLFEDNVEGYIVLLNCLCTETIST